MSWLGSSSTWRVIAVLLVLLAGTVSSQGKVIYVDADGPADFNNIQAAIDDAENGDVVDVTIELSSGVAAFDQSALRAVLSSSPPPLPLEYTGNQLGIHLQFQYLP